VKRAEEEEEEEKGEEEEEEEEWCGKLRGCRLLSVEGRRERGDGGLLG